MGIVNVVIMVLQYFFKAIMSFLKLVVSLHQKKMLIPVIIVCAVCIGAFFLWNNYEISNNNTMLLSIIVAISPISILFLYILINKGIPEPKVEFIFSWIAMFFSYLFSLFLIPFFFSVDIVNFYVKIQNTKYDIDEIQNTIQIATEIQNIAFRAFFILLLIGLLSFIVVFIITKKPFKNCFFYAIPNIVFLVVFFVCFPEQRQYWLELLQSIFNSISSIFLSKRL